MFGYKLIDYKDGKYNFLYHGLNRSMKIPFGMWLEANSKLVSDGKGTKYISGFHYFRHLEDALSYIHRFTIRQHMKRIAIVLVDNVYKKEHSKSEVYLAKKMKMIGILDV